MICKKLSARLIEDAKNLETQMDKILQLSRIEQGGKTPSHSYGFAWPFGQNPGQMGEGSPRVL